MKRQINTVLSFKGHKQYNKIFFLISLLFLLISQIYSQTNLPKRAKLKTITYSDYTITGYVSKKHFVNGQKVQYYH